MFGLSAITRNIAAVFLHSHIDVNEGSFTTYVVDKMSHPSSMISTILGDINVNGVKALNSFGMNGLAYGVLETGGDHLVFFHIKNNPVIMTFQMLDGYELAFGCTMNSAMLSRINGNASSLTMFTIQACAGGRAYVGLLDYTNGRVKNVGSILFPEDNF